MVSNPSDHGRIVDTNPSTRLTALPFNTVSVFDQRPSLLHFHRSRPVTWVVRGRPKASPPACRRSLRPPLNMFGTNRRSDWKMPHRRRRSPAPLDGGGAHIRMADVSHACINAGEECFTISLPASRARRHRERFYGGFPLMEGSALHGATGHQRWRRCCGWRHAVMRSAHCGSRTVCRVGSRAG